MHKKTKTTIKKINEKTIDEIRKDFIKIIPQLQEIQKVQKTHQEIQKKEAEKKYPYIDTQSFSTV